LTNFKIEKEFANHIIYYIYIAYTQGQPNGSADDKHEELLGEINLASKFFKKKKKKKSNWELSQGNT